MAPTSSTGTSALVDISSRLARRVARLRFSEPTSYVYNPLQYAKAPHEAYLSRYGAAPKEVLMLGMNPGPFGMSQTGVPFGEVSLVRDWMGIEAPVGRPRRQHPKRTIDGFACSRSEVSGARLWGWARDRFGAPENFFSRFFVSNYCPLVFMEASGRNRTPDKLPAEERDQLFKVCDAAVVEIYEYFKPELVVGVGAFAEKRARAALEDRSVRIASILHPSPASPIANRGWAPQAERQLTDLGVSLS